jgi:HD-GYP domain-containing protein (c-di-GMP phosphodiesterase class II)
MVLSIAAITPCATPDLMSKLNWTTSASPELNRALQTLDKAIFDHSHRVARIAFRLGEIFDLSGHDLAILALAAQLHDVGKMAVPAKILNSPNRLTVAQMTIMKTHSAHGERIIRSQRDIPFNGEISTVVRHHHEHWDGSGYPDGLRQQAIPLLSRLIAVADSWDAMSSRRPYHPGRAPGDVLNILQGERGSKHDPAVVDAFIEEAAPMARDLSFLPGACRPALPAQAAGGTTTFW